MTLSERQENLQTPTDKDISKSCKYCHGFGTVHVFNGEDSEERACPVCSGGSQFNKMVGAPEFDLKK